MSGSWMARPRSCTSWLNPNPDPDPDPNPNPNPSPSPSPDPNQVLHELASHERWRDTKVAAASRTNKPRWARALLQDFGVPGCTGRKLADLIPFQEIYTGSKVAHFKALREVSHLAACVGLGLA